MGIGRSFFFLIWLLWPKLQIWQYSPKVVQLMGVLDLQKAGPKLWFSLKVACSTLTCIAMSEGRFKEAVREGCFFFFLNGMGFRRGNDRIHVL